VENKGMDDLMNEAEQKGWDTTPERDREGESLMLEDEGVLVTIEFDEIPFDGPATLIVMEAGEHKAQIHPDLLVELPTPVQAREILGL
jgi:hypothetical protein